MRPAPTRLIVDKDWTCRLNPLNDLLGWDKIAGRLERLAEGKGEGVL